MYGLNHILSRKSRKNSKTWSKIIRLLTSTIVIVVLCIPVAIWCNLYKSSCYRTLSTSISFSYKIRVEHTFIRFSLVIVHWFELLRAQNYNCATIFSIIILITKILTSSTYNEHENGFSKLFSRKSPRVRGIADFSARAVLFIENRSYRVHTLYVSTYSNTRVCTTVIYYVPTHCVYYTIRIALTQF